MKTKISFHGELCIVEVDEIPSRAKPIKTYGKDYKLADSEATGNHHMLSVHPGVALAGFDGDVYAKVTEKSSKIYCMLENRHTDHSLDSGKTYKIVPSQEWDYIEQQRRAVRD